MSYRTIQDFGSNLQKIPEEPLTYCMLDGLNAQFMHGAQGKIFGRYNRECAEYISSRCAVNWDEVCQASSTNTNPNFPDMTGREPECCSNELTQGQLLIRDTAYKKYLLVSTNCNVRCEPFDPTVVDSPLICYEYPDTLAVNNSNVSIGGVTNCQGNLDLSPSTCQLDNNTTTGGPCQKIYGIKDENISNLDTDFVMNSLIDNLKLAPNLLFKIYTGMKQMGKLSYLTRTRLGSFYLINGYPLN